MNILNNNEYFKCLTINYHLFQDDVILFSDIKGI